MALRFQQLWLFVVVVLMATCGALAKEEDESSLGLRRNRRAAIDVIHILPEEHRRGRARARGLKNEKGSKKSKGMKTEKEPKAHTMRGVDADLSEVFFRMSMSMSMSM
mmetsp:Transcript_19774/g.49193  ORF Transcript_19774/g.49193 Transcript_19774/m.49193 type:complete len:108 (-) Transcript_19774:392-715(-)|eukprot:CAMPEP_0116101206 /NCGR_PEP_ID=MMETSP0327-20121206/12689_1 /TAXON_ID=44447 /ORGANISM="Pseudo-nitzschia delicatissima, Strain B596" /LENGTH=107 /DNA_ID=CAMNT_0003593157 /DNA_START=109 /DNA_END=432 /DNA_ORIENTATION=+